MSINLQATTPQFGMALHRNIQQKTGPDQVRTLEAPLADKAANTASQREHGHDVVPVTYTVINPDTGVTVVTGTATGAHSRYLREKLKTVVDPLGFYANGRTNKRPIYSHTGCGTYETGTLELTIPWSTYVEMRDTVTKRNRSLRTGKS